MSYNQVTQPLKIKVGLYPHQLTSIYNMKQLERKEIISNESIYINHKIGFLSDKTGYGKTLSMLGLVASDEKTVSDQCTIHKIKHGNNFFNYYTMSKTKNVSTSLVIVRPELISHWETELKKTDLSYFTVIKQTDIDIENYDIVLCSSKIFSYFFNLWNNIEWKRVVIDEPMTMKLKKTDIPFSSFYWFITHTPYEMLSKKCSSFFDNILQGVEDYDMLKCVIVKNDDEYIEQSFSMPQTSHTIHHYSHNFAKALDGVVSQCVMELIQSSNYETAVKHLNTNKDDILSSLKEKNVDLYNTVVNRLVECVCPICTDSLKSPVIFTCCYNVYCDGCVSEWLRMKKSCPLCREDITMEKIIELSGPSSGNEKREVTPSLLKTREEIFKNLIKTCKKTIVFCNYDESFRIIKKILEHENIKYGTLKGKREARTKVIEDYIRGEIPVILLNSLYNGSGLELQNTTDIILYHDMNEYTKVQAIGRANRIGRTSNLNVHYLKMY